VAAGFECQWVDDRATTVATPACGKPALFTCEILDGSVVESVAYMCGVHVNRWKTVNYDPTRTHRVAKLLDPRA
jgi:hypothetical protein